MNNGTMLLPLVAIILPSASLATSPFDGTWTVNVSRSHVTAGTMSWRDAGNGRLTFTNPNESYTFRPDGHPFPAPLGMQQAVEKINDDFYKTTIKLGSLVINETWKVSPDGQTLLVEGSRTGLSGTPVGYQQHFVRTSTGTGLVGHWTNTAVLIPLRNTLMISSTGRKAVTLRFAADHSTIRCRWDGMDCPDRGPTVPARTTMALSRTGASSFELVHKINATVVEVLRFRLSHNGTSMIEGGTNGGGVTLFVDVWDKQS